MTDSENFKLYKGSLLFDKAPHCSIRLSNKQLINILHNGGGYLIRNTYEFDCKDITEFYYVIKDSFNGMEELSSKMRNQVRKSLRTYDVRIVEREEILKHGLEINNKAIRHYKVRAKESSREDFEKRINNHNGDFWMVYHKETYQPVAFAINTIEDNTCNYSTIKLDPDFFGSTYPMYGLIYKMNEYYLLEKGLKYVNDGARSITEHSNIQDFLIQKFNFRKAYCKLQIKYKWYVKIPINILYPLRKLIKERRIRALLYQEWMYRHSR